MLAMPFCLVISIVAVWLMCTDQDVLIVRKDPGIALGRPYQARTKFGNKAKAGSENVLRLGHADLGVVEALLVPPISWWWVTK